MPQHYSENSWTERTARARADGPDYSSPTADIDRAFKQRQAFHNPHTSLGLAGHWVGLAGTMAPLLITEFVTDPAQWRKAIRLTAIGTAIAYEGLYTLRELQHRREQQAKLDACRGREA